MKYSFVTAALVGSVFASQHHKGHGSFHLRRGGYDAAPPQPQGDVCTVYTTVYVSQPPTPESTSCTEELPHPTGPTPNVPEQSQPGYPPAPPKQTQPGYPTGPVPNVPQQSQPGYPPAGPKSQPPTPEQCTSCTEETPHPTGPVPNVPQQSQPGYPTGPQPGYPTGPTPNVPEQSHPGYPPAPPMSTPGQPGHPPVREQSTSTTCTEETTSPTPGVPQQTQPGYPTGPHPNVPQESHPGYPPAPPMSTPGQPGHPPVPEQSTSTTCTEETTSPTPGVPQQTQPGYPTGPHPGYPTGPTPNVPQQSKPTVPEESTSTTCTEETTSPTPGVPQQTHPGYPTGPSPSAPQESHPGYPTGPQPGYPTGSTPAAMSTPTYPNGPQQSKPTVPEQSTESTTCTDEVSKPISPVAVQSMSASSPTGNTPYPTGSYGSTGHITTNGNKWAITYTPYAQSGQCKTHEEIVADIKKIHDLGFTTARFYSTDCNVFEWVVPECQKYGLKIIYGIFLEAGDKGCFSEHADEQLQDIKNKAPKDSVAMVIVGNECIFNGNCQPQQLASYIDHVRQELYAAGFPKSIAITTTEPVGTWQDNGAALCDHIDVMACNVQPYFTSSITADMAGDFAASQLELANKVCPGAAAKGSYIVEIGWPSQGSANGQAVPGVNEQKTAIHNIMYKVGDHCAVYSFNDDSWKPAGPHGVEQHFGCIDALSSY